MDFGFKFIDKEGYVLLSLTGNLMETGQASELMEEVVQRSEKSPHFVVDLSGFKYMNSTGLGVLLNILTLARKSGGDVVICCVPEKVKSLLVITKLINIFSVTDDEQRAAKVLLPEV